MKTKENKQLYFTARSLPITVKEEDIQEFQSDVKANTTNEASCLSERVSEKNGSKNDRTTPTPINSSKTSSNFENITNIARNTTVLSKSVHLSTQVPKNIQKSWTRTSYFEIRETKLREQAPVSQSDLLSGKHFYFTGVKTGGQRHLEGLVWRYGGVVHRVWYRRKITHVIADNLASSKLEKEIQTGSKWAGVIVKPSWLVESINKRKLMPTWEYRLVKGPADVADVAKFFCKGKAGVGCKQKGKIGIVKKGR